MPDLHVLLVIASAVLVGVTASEESQTPLRGQSSGYRVIDCPPYTQTSIECGLLDVPLDWHNSSLGSTTLNIFRRIPQGDWVNQTEPKISIFVHEGLSYTGKDLSLLSIDQQFIRQNHSIQKIFGNQHNLVYWTSRDRNLTGLPPTCFKDLPEKTGFYKRTLRKDLSYEPEWYEDGTLTWGEPQDAEAVQMFLRAQEKAVRHCVERMGSSLFKYMGTAATVRDIVAMADALDGPGSSINLWAQTHGSMVASYLLKMFPERVGRIVMDDPVDPVAFTETASHLRWLADIASANNTLAVLEREMAMGTADGFAFSSGFIESDVIMAKQKAIDIGNELIGWRNKLDVDLRQKINQERFEMRLSENKILWGFSNRSFTREYNHANRARLGSSYGLDLLGMPLACGDTIYSPESSQNAIEALLVDNIGSAPLMATKAFPALRFLCHLWPIRAVERLSLRPPYEANLSQNVVILLHKRDYWTYHTASESDAHQLWPGANIFSEMRYGVSQINKDLVFERISEQ
ncbi:hypothetical protein C8Q74DRAFT_255326 [Fomes fomentarius]|nr:hypothetical protein C8Q74DRAFT_255326 [Fomes fomentarius]